jgi:hypothetical protein
MKSFRQYVENRITYTGLPQQPPGAEAERDNEIAAIKSNSMVPGDKRFSRLGSLLQDKHAADAPPQKGEPYVGLGQPAHVKRERRFQDLRSRQRMLSPEERMELSQMMQDKAAADAPPTPMPPYQRMPESPSLQRDQEIDQLRSLGVRKTMEQRIRLAHLLGQKNKEDYDYDAHRGG